MRFVGKLEGKKNLIDRIIDFNSDASIAEKMLALMLVVIIV